MKNSNILENFDLSQALKKLREQLSYSQEDLARELGVSFATINRWENNKQMGKQSNKNHQN